MAVLLVVTPDGYTAAMAAVDSRKCSSPQEADTWLMAGNLVAKRMMEFLREIG